MPVRGAFLKGSVNVLYGLDIIASIKCRSKGFGLPCWPPPLSVKVDYDYNEVWI